MTPSDSSFQQRGPRGPPNKLHAAVAAGSAAGTLAVLSTGLIDIDQGTPAGDTPLIISVGVGCSRVTKILLNKGAETSIANDDGCTALHLSAQLGRLPMTKMLIKAAAPVDSTAAAGYSPLHFCARKGHWEVMSALIEAGANPDGRSDDGGTPLCDAAIDGHLEATRVLLRAQANAMLARTDVRGASSYVPLEMAAHNGHSGVVGELVQQRGIEACGGPSGGVEALRLAALAQRLDIMETLSKAGVIDTGIVLVVAAGSGYLAVVKFLLQQHQKEGRPTAGRSAYLNSACGRYGAPPLLHAMGFSGFCSPKIVRLLVDAGADTSSSVRVTNKSRFVAFNDTPLAFLDVYLSSKKLGGGKVATERQLRGLEAIRRLLLQAEAVHAVSWLWPASDAPRATCTAESSTRVERALTLPTPIMSMMPILRRSASRHRRVVMPAVFRYSKEPSLGAERWCLHRLFYFSADWVGLRSFADAVQWAAGGWLRVAVCLLCVFFVAVRFNV